jgi:hypothetical protein
MHLGLIDGTFVPHYLIIDSGEPCPFTEVPDGPQTLTFNVLRVHRRGIQIYFSFLSKVLANEPPPVPPTGLL